MWEAVSLALVLLLFGLGLWTLRRDARAIRRHSATDSVSGSREAAGGEPEVSSNPLLKRITDLEIEFDAIAKRHVNACDTCDERYRRLAARLRGETPAASAAPGSPELDPTQFDFLKRPPAAAAVLSPNGQRRHLVPRR